MQKIRDWLVASYNGLYKIVLEPYMPRRKTIAFLVVGFLIGLGWAYVLSPTVYYNADPSTLDASWRTEWVRLLADRYELATTTGVPSAEFEAEIVDRLRRVENPAAIAANLDNASPEFVQLAQQAEPGQPAPQPNMVSSLVPFIIGPIVIGILAVVLWLLWGLLIYGNIVQPIMKRLRGDKAVSDDATQKTIDAMRAARDAEKKARESAPAEEDLGLGEPVTRRMSVYLMGRGQYDDSFEIEDDNEMFLGECGASISETIGEGTPQKVTAIEIWLFDKDDYVKTFTNIFATEYAFNDPTIRSRLETTGEVLLMQPGATIVLETKMLILKARIVDMKYGTGDQPPNSFLESSTIEVSVWQKEGAGTAAESGPFGGAATPPPINPPATAPNYETAPAARPSTPALGIDPYAPAPAASPPPLPDFPSSPPPPPPQDDDPFGGTAEFDPTRN